MKLHNTKFPYALTLAFSLAALAGANAWSAEAGGEETEERQLQARLEAEYENAMSAAERQQIEAEASLERAREQLEQAAEQRALAEKQGVEELAAREAQMAKMHEELNNARRQLQETSREIARVNREVARARADRDSNRFVYRVSERPVIGVVLGGSDKGGVEILGVSPDGPAERAGIKKGDLIVAVNGIKLTEAVPSQDAREGLRIALNDMQADQPLLVSVLRDKRTVDLTVVPEVREPLTWQTITRFPSAPSAPAAPGAPAVPGAPAAPDKVITVEHISVPEIDTEALSVQIEQMRTEIEKRRAQMDAARTESTEDTWQIEIDELSELGNLALQDAHVWFGLPLAQGLQLAEVDSGLGEYFKTDRGVLVLKARPDNGLQLESGDVILKVGETEVNTPAEFMRALRAFDPGDELVMDIKRGKKDRTLKTVMPESRSSFFISGDDKAYSFSITTSTE